MRDSRQSDSLRPSRECIHCLLQLRDQQGLGRIENQPKSALQTQASLGKHLDGGQIFPLIIIIAIVTRITELYIFK